MFSLLQNIFHKHFDFLIFKVLNDSQRNDFFEDLMSRLS